MDCDSFSAPKRTCGVRLRERTQRRGSPLHLGCAISMCPGETRVGVLKLKSGSRPRMGADETDYIVGLSVLVPGAMFRCCLAWAIMCSTCVRLGSLGFALRNACHAAIAAFGSDLPCHWNMPRL